MPKQGTAEPIAALNRIKHSAVAPAKIGRKYLLQAAALIVAEIERQDRMAAKPK